MNLGMEKRGTCVKTETMDARRLMLTYRFPLNEIITDFNDKLKSITKGYGSLIMNSTAMKKAISSNWKFVSMKSLSMLFPASSTVQKPKQRTRHLCKTSRSHPHAAFKVPIQAAIGGKIVARETIRAITKNVTAKCYGGDITRKRKLWEKQKKGKKRMKEIGKVNIPQSAFMEVLKAGD